MLLAAGPGGRRRNTETAYGVKREWIRRALLLIAGRVCGVILIAPQRGPHRAAGGRADGGTSAPVASVSTWFIAAGHPSQPGSTASERVIGLVLPLPLGSPFLPVLEHRRPPLILACDGFDHHLSPRALLVELLILDHPPPQDGNEVQRQGDVRFQTAPDLVSAGGREVVRSRIQRHRIDALQTVQGE